MNTHRTKPVTVYANVGMDDETAIEARLASRDTEAVEINIGYGPELIIDCGDVASLERLRDAAVAGARLLRERIEENRLTTAQPCASTTRSFG